MRTFFVGIFFLVVSFGVPFFTNAQGDFFYSTDTYEISGDSLGQTTPQNPSVSLINPLGTSCNPANTDCLGNFLRSILAFVIRIGTVVVILMLVYVGYKFVTARGEPAEITKARTMLLWTVVGALILLGAQVIAVGITATVQSLGTGS